MKPEDAYQEIKKIYQNAQADIDRLASEHKERVEQTLREADRKKIDRVRAKIEKL